MQILRSLWLFIQDQVLGMKWLNVLIGDLLSLLGLDTASRLGGSVQFFVYDVVKITVLLCFLIFVIYGKGGQKERAVGGREKDDFLEGTA